MNSGCEEKSKVAETLKEYRGQYAYNLLDESYRRFAAEVAQIQARIELVTARAALRISAGLPLKKEYVDGRPLLHRLISY